MNRWQCYLYMLIHQASWVAWVTLIVMAGLVAAGFIHSLWAALAAVAVDIFIAVMTMSFVIIAFGFNSITGVNMGSHSLSTNNDGLVIKFDDGKEIEVKKSDILPYHIYPGGVIVPVKGAKAGWVWVPPGAFDTDGEFRNFLKSLYANESNTE